MDQRGWERLIAGLELGDPDGEVAAAWLAVQLFRKVYAAGNKGAATRALNRFYQHCRDRQIPELDTMHRTVGSWQYEILAYHSTGQSNGPTEAVNLIIEKVRRIGHGFRNFDLCCFRHKSNYVAGRVMSRGVDRLVCQGDRGFD